MYSIHLVRMSQLILGGRQPWGLAVDAAGNVFVAFSGDGRINEYTTSGGSFIRDFTGRVRAVGVDLQGGNIFACAVPEGPYEIQEFDSSGNTLASFGSGLMSSPGVASPGIAVNSTTGAVYVADTANNVVDIFGALTLPEPTTCSASTIGETTATLHGAVNPEGTKAESLFQYGTEKTYGLETPLELVGGGLEATHNLPVEASVTGLIPGTVYHCRITATNSTTVFNDGPDGTFETLPLAPVVDEPPAVVSEVTTSSVIFDGFVNPGNGVTRYHFAYGREAGHYTTSLPSVGIGTGLIPVPVEQASLPDSLTPGTVYHFALIATNAAGTIIGSDQTFSTTSSGAAPEVLPVLSTGPATAVAQNSATITGTAYAEGTATICCFHLGVNSSYGTVIVFGRIEPEHGAVLCRSERFRPSARHYLPLQSRMLQCRRHHGRAGPQLHHHSLPPGNRPALNPWPGLDPCLPARQKPGAQTPPPQKEAPQEQEAPQSKAGQD